jgi:hypothetical protein
MLASVQNSTERPTVSTTKMFVVDGSGHDLGNASEQREQHQTQIPVAAMRERLEHACLVDLLVDVCNECDSAQCCCRTRDSLAAEVRVLARSESRESQSIMLDINQTPPAHERDCYRDLGQATGAGINRGRGLASQRSSVQKSSEGYIKHPSSLFENVYTHFGAKTATHTSHADEYATKYDVSSSRLAQGAEDKKLVSSAVVTERERGESPTSSRQEVYDTQVADVDEVRKLLCQCVCLW